MPITEVTGPDGRLHHIEHPAGALPSQIIKIAQSQIGPGPSKPGAFSNFARAGFAGASELGYDAIQMVTDSAIKQGSFQAQTELLRNAQYYEPEVLDEELNKINPMKRKLLRKSQSIIGDTGRMSGEAFGVDEGRFSADLGRGVGQLVPQVFSAGLAAVPMAVMESRRDAERTFGVPYSDMTQEQQAKVDIAGGTYAMFSLALNRVGLRGMGLNKLDDFFKGSATVKGSVVKEILKGSARGGAVEFGTETTEAAAMDQLFARIYDDDREFSFSDVNDYMYEGFIASIIGAGAGGGTSTVKALAGDPRSAVEETGKPTEEGEVLEVPRTVEVTYKQTDGKVRVVPIAVSKDQDPLTVAQEELSGRYDESEPLIINETFEETSGDFTFGETDAEILEEGVPVDPVPTPAPVPAPAPEQAPEPAPDLDVDGVKPVQQLEQIEKRLQELGELNDSIVDQYSDDEIDQAEFKNRTQPITKEIVELSRRQSVLNKALRDPKLVTRDPEYISRLEAIQNRRRSGEITFEEALNEDTALRREIEARITGAPEPTPAPTPTPTPVPEPSVETAPESSPDPTAGKTVSELAQEVGITEQNFRETYPDLSRRADEGARSTEPEVDPRTGLPGFSLPQNLKKGKPGYRQTQGITFASDLERAAYSATTSTRSEPGKRKRDSYRKILQDAGYSSTEINTMGREVRSQMRKQYKGPGSELSVALPQDVVAQAAPLEISQVSDENNSLRIGTALQKGKNTTTPEDNVSPDRITPANLKKQMAKMTHFVKKIVKDGKEKGRDIKFPKWMRAKGGAKAQSEAFIKQFKDNLIALHNAFPEEYRARATQWYDGARKIVDRAAEQTGLTPEQVAGVMAALSPLKDWFQNVQMGLNLVDVATNNSDDVFTQAQYKDAINIVLDQSSDNTVRNQRKKLFKLLEGKTIRELFNQGTKESKQLAAWAARIISTSKHGFYHDVLSPEGNSLGIRRNKDGSPKAMVWQSIPFIVKSLDIVYDGSVENISNQLGKKHKIRNFYNNIIAPNSPYGDATIDTHAVNATTLFPMGGSGYQADLNFGKAGVGGGGVSGTYWLHLEAYKQAAKEVGIQPRQMQSITWEAIRMLFPDVDKRDQKFIDKYENIWNNSTDAETTRQQILSEGIEPPEWATYRPRPLRGAEAVEASVRENARPKVEPTRSVQADDGPTSRGDVTAQAAETAAEDRGPQDTFENGSQVMDFIEKSFNPIAEKLGLAIRPAMRTDYVAQYNVTQKVIEYNPMALLNRSKAGIQAAMREEIIHAAMHNVLIQKEKKARTGRSEDALWIDFFTALGNNLTPQERTEIQNVYQSLQEGDTVGFGSEYSRAVVQKFRYGDFSEQYVMPDKGGPAFQAIVDLLRSVQAYMAKVLGPMVKTDPEAAQVIVDTVELLNAIDPAIRPKSQNVVANAYNATDKNTAQENAEGDRAPKDASQRMREERKWWDGKLRSKLSKSLTPIITKLRRINPQFALLFQRLENTIRERSLKYKKQSQPFFNKLNSLNSKDFNELKRLLFFSPTPAEANLPKNKATIQRRDALLHKHGLLNMYRLDVQPILEEIYSEYVALGMPIGYLEDYFPRVVKDLEGLIKSYGYETKRTFGNLVREENARRKEEGQPEMESSERARFFQDFLQNKSNFGPKGVRPPGNVKVREIQTIEPSRLKFYEDPSIAFGNYTTNMVSAIEAYQVLGSTNQAGNKGKTGKLGELTERLFQQGLIDEQDASELKSAAELATVQAGQELVPLRELGAATYVFTLIDVGTVLIQFLDLAKVLVLRGPTATAKGVYRTVTGNRVYDIEEDFSIVKKQIMAEFDQESGTQKLLNLGLRYVVPFQLMDVFAKHATVEATLIDFLKKANAKVGSKPYRQLMTELTIRMGPDAAFKAVQGMRRDTFDKNIPEVKEAVMMELFDRQPLTYLQIPETHRRNPNSRLLYKLKTFMLLDINFNRELALNDLMGPDKTVKQRYKGLKMLVAMMAALTAIGVPKDLLLDFIRGKDTYLSDHVINNMLQVFGLSRYGIGTIFEDGPVDAIVDRFKPAAYSILDGGENDLLAWVKGDREISEFRIWKNLPVFDIWGRFTEDFQEKKQKLYREKRKEGQRPTIRR